MDYQIVIEIFLPQILGVKNQFNSSFPALCNYMDSNGIPVNYICYKNSEHMIDVISVSDLYGIHYAYKDIFFAFESQYLPYAKNIIGSLPRTDLVIQGVGACLRGLEVSEHPSREADYSAWHCKCQQHPCTNNYPLLL